MFSSSNSQEPEFVEVNKQVKNWTEEDVGKWLDLNGFSSLRSRFSFFLKI